MLQLVIHRVRCLVSKRPHKIVAYKNEAWYQNLTSEPSDMVTQLRDLSLTKQHDLCITVERHAIRLALSLFGTYVCSKVIKKETCTLPEKYKKWCKNFEKMYLNAEGY